MSCNKTPEVLTVKKWDTITLDFEGPEVNETDELNPFLEYSLAVVFSKGDKSFGVPGYFAADGNAAETGADKGNIWRVKFTPDEVGEWTYKVNFKKGTNYALAGRRPGHKVESIGDDGKIGKFIVEKGDFPINDFRHHGRLTTIKGKTYQQFAETKKYFIKGGADSPENFLAFHEFDGTYDMDSTNQFLHKYEAHVKDWKEGDPTWQNGKGKGIIGALNYLASKGMNAVYFLSMNIEGDGKDVWMYNRPDDFTRFDCSKLDQWEIVFEHAQSKGILLHFVTQETENELLLDNGDTSGDRQLYYKELIARFGHHLAVTWNMGEENGPADFTPKGQNHTQRNSMFDFFDKWDPYENLVALHTHAAPRYKDSILMPEIYDRNLDAFSMQIHHPDDVYEEITKWKKITKDAGNELIMYMDEIGPYWQGVLPDSYDSAHDTVRIGALWGSLMAGAAGVEWYYGYKYPHADLNCEDWRSREKMWEKTKYAMDFFQNHLPFWEMSPQENILENTNGHCLAKEGEIYAIYLPLGIKKAVLNTDKLKGEKVSIAWYNPRTGGSLQNQKTITAEDKIYLGEPPENDNKDWVVLVEKI